MKKAHDLIIDLGNSRVKYYLVDLPGFDLYLSVDDLPNDSSYDTYIISSVPSQTQLIVDEFKAKRELASLEIFDPQKQSSLTNLYPGFGADRVAKLIGALDLNPGSNIILMDFGTATTIGVANANREFLGGFISLGLRASMKALSEDCDALDDFSKDLRNLLGEPDMKTNNTRDAIVHGAYTAHLGLINEWIFRARKLINNDQPTLTICTGGGASSFLNYFDKHIEDGELLGAFVEGLKSHH